jgi:hypothetical protein
LPLQGQKKKALPARLAGVGSVENQVFTFFYAKMGSGGHSTGKKKSWCGKPHPLYMGGIFNMKKQSREGKKTHLRQTTAQY